MPAPAGAPAAHTRGRRIWMEGSWGFAIDCVRSPLRPAPGPSADDERAHRHRQDPPARGAAAALRRRVHHRRGAGAASAQPHRPARPGRPARAQGHAGAAAPGRTPGRGGAARGLPGDGLGRHGRRRLPAQPRHLRAAQGAGRRPAGTALHRDHPQGRLPPGRPDRAGAGGRGGARCHCRAGTGAARAAPGKPGTAAPHRPAPGAGRPRRGRPRHADLAAAATADARRRSAAGSRLRGCGR